MYKLTEREKMCLYALEQTCEKYEMYEYCICNFCEQRECICKRETDWKEFERGLEFNKTKYKDCIDACLEVIKLCSYSIDEFKDASKDFINIFKNNKKQIRK